MKMKMNKRLETKRGNLPEVDFYTTLDGQKLRARQPKAQAEFEG